MALSPSLDLHQSQSLAMTPRLMQSLKLLQMTALELEQYLNDELEKNPLLERVDGLDDSIDAGMAHLSNAVDGEQNNETSISAGEPDTLNDTQFEFEVLENLYGGNDETTQLTGKKNNLKKSEEKSLDWNELPSRPLSLDVVNIEEIIADRPGLRQFVAEQIVFSFDDAVERNIAYYLADYLDEAGYFSGNLEEVAEKFEVKTSDIAVIIKRLQQFDPPGIFARSLQECLSLQLERINRLDPAIAIVLDNLPALAKRNFIYLSKISGLNQSELIDALQEIRRLNPKPGLAFCYDPSDFIVPDVIIRRSDDNNYTIELNQAVLPKLVVHHDYTLEIGANANDRRFVSECLQNANWLLKALDQRAKTLLKVTATIVEYQKKFLDCGIGFLKPLNLATVAEKIGMHESTISRVTANKYVATPRGTFEMRSFFSVALPSTAGEETYAADAVRHRIRELIDSEDADHILSDDALVRLLQKENIDIARRTVAKYRELMNISSSVTRRREKKALQKTIHD